MARSLWRRVDRWFTLFHRWAGVVLSALFLIWFLSGAVLHFVGFPAVSQSEQLNHLPLIPLDRVDIAPSSAVHGFQADGLRLINVAGRPVYIVSRSSGNPVAVAADTGQILSPFSATTAAAVAESFDGRPVLGTTGPIMYDQWIVPNELDPFRPMYRVRMSDASGREIYVSARTGEVVQVTTATEREWNWGGAILHWIYFTPLRKDWWAWDKVVWWTSLVATVSVVVGIWLGFIRFMANRAARRRGISPYRGWLKWHHVVGLFVSVIVLAWIFSGWLTMDHGRIFPLATPTSGEVNTYRGMPFAQIANSVTVADLRASGPAVQIGMNAIAGHPFLDVRQVPAENDRIRWVGGGVSAAPGIGKSMLRAGLEAVWPDRLVGEVQRDQDDALYRLAESMPASAVGFQLRGSGATRVYVDDDSGRILAVLGPGRRAYDWVCFAVHTLDFPGLLDHPDLRTIVELMLLALGAAFSGTGVILSVKRLKRSF